MHTFSVCLGCRWEKLPWASREHTDVESWIREYVELQVNVLVSSHPSVLKEDDRQGAGVRKAEVSEDGGRSHRSSDQGSRTTFRLRS